VACPKFGKQITHKLKNNTDKLDLPMRSSEWNFTAENVVAAFFVFNNDFR
jgi:hypothetical protein